MQIQILAVNRIPSTTAKGQAYDLADVAFKNLTFQGKVEGKKLTPFGSGKPAYETLLNSQPGQVFDITVVKENGFNNWTSATPGQAGNDQSPRPASQPSAVQAPAPAARQSSFETPEERAKKQVTITRLAVLNTAASTLAIGAKSPVKKEDVVETAKFFEAWALGIEAPKNFDSFSDMENDIPM